MEPIDRRITAVTLLMLRDKPHPEQALEALLRVREMAVPDSERTKQEIENFVASGSATAASQLIHAAQVRCPATPTPPATS